MTISTFGFRGGNISTRGFLRRVDLIVIPIVDTIGDLRVRPVVRAILQAKQGVTGRLRVRRDVA